jgi:1A family penicillin-binding protein
MHPAIQQDKSKKKAFIAIGTLVFLAITVLVVAFLFFKDKTIEEFRLIQATQNVNTVFYDIDQKPFHIIQGEEDRKYVPLSQVSHNLQKAVVAIEDSRFFRHFGFDPVRIIAVAFRNLNPDLAVQGASTITQQLIKLTLLSPEKTIQRKLTELFMAMALEFEFSKAEILEYYLNKVYFGYRSYGVENASLNYFHKTTKELTVAESAFIAGLIKKPEGYSPFVNLKMARQRQLLVLKRLRALDWITQQEYEIAVNEHLLIRERRKSELQIAPYFVAHILQTLKNDYGKRLVSGSGLHVYTTLDTKFQQAMENVIEQRMVENPSFNEIAGVSIDPDTGFVKALVGGTDFYKSEFNRVTQARRQPGSSFKPIVYATALSEGIKPNDTYWDEPTQYTRVTENDIEVYEPGNYTGEHLGQMTVAYALRTSNNVVSVQILNSIGINKLLPTARLFGIELPEDRGLCLALGCGETTLLDLVDAYTVFANQGFRATPVFVLKITDSQDRLLEEFEPQPEIQVLSPNVAFQMNRLLQDVVNLGTGQAARIETISGGKTGTSDLNRDAWYIGYTADLVSGFWIGNDGNEPMEGELGGRTPAKLWKTYMELLPKPQVQKGFAINENFEDYLICDQSGKLATTWCPIKNWYALEKSSLPSEYCDIHTDEELQVDICKTSNKRATRFCPLDEVESKRFISGTEPNERCDVHLNPETIP